MTLVVHPRKANRGPSAAAENRAALVAAAREVFASAGFDAPLSAVARRAGVGQGSLYRHFPDRASLALAVFEANIAELEALAADPRATLDDLLALITEQIIASSAFIDMIRPSREDERLAEVGERMAALLTGKLAAAREAGSVRPDLGIGDLFLTIGMLAGVLAKTPADSRRRTAEHAWRLLRRSLRP